MNRKIKILQFTIAKSLGGRSQYILNIWKKIDKEIFSFDFVSFSTKDEYPKDFNIDGGNLYYIQNRPEKNRDKFIDEFLKILENGYDVIEIHTSFWEDTIVEELSRKANIPKIIIHSHNSGIIAGGNNNDRCIGEDLSLIHERVKAQLNDEIATDFWACSREAAKWLFEPQISKEKIKIIHNTIDTTRFKYDREKRKKARLEFGLKEEIVLGFVGRLELSKNISFLLNILCDVLIKNKNIKLFIVGDGSLRTQLIKEVREKGIEDNVVFTGRRVDTDYIYNAIDCFLLPSLYEGFPIALLEAQCTGLKCIISDLITEEVCVTSNVKRLPLTNEEKWISEILSVKQEMKKRTDQSELLRENGFDSDIEIIKLEKMYLGNRTYD